jgi:hypothetical protein
MIARLHAFFHRVRALDYGRKLDENPRVYVLLDGERVLIKDVLRVPDPEEGSVIVIEIVLPVGRE